MKKLSNILIIGFVLCILESCKHNETIILGSIYGTITDVITSEPIRGAHVELLPIGLTIDTGDEGLFEFAKVEGGTYNLYVTKKGYTDYKTNNIVVKGNGDDKPINIQLEKLPPALTILDDNGNKIDTIQFGSDEGVTTRSFNIFNNSDEKLEWSLEYDEAQCEWIKSFSLRNGVLNSNASQSLVITIDRYKLNVGENSTIVHVVSNNGSKQLKLIATCINVVETKEASDIGSTSAVLNAYIVRDMKPSITEYGFVYSDLPAPSLNNSAKKKCLNGTAKQGMFSMLVDGLEKETQYFALAYVTNNVDTIYGNQISFSTISHTPELDISINKFSSTTIEVGYFVSDAGIPLQEVGLCWGTEPLPTTDDNHKKFGEEAGTYYSTINELAVNTGYFIRAYAINAEGVYYSVQMYQITKDGKPSVTTYSVKEKGVDYLIVSGNATSEAGIPIVRQGICYSTLPHPTLSDHYVEASVNSPDFSCRLTGLQQGTKYYFVAFAETAYGGPKYGNEQYAYTDYMPAILNGYVYNQSGTPVQAAAVDAYEGITGYSAITDVNGYYEISIDIKRSSNTCKFMASKEGYSSQVKQVTIYPGQTTQQDFTLAANASEETGAIFTIPNGSIMVQTVDLGSAQWGSANTMCQESTLGGFTDWRLPTIAELRIIYNYKSQIGGFPNRVMTASKYWSSDNAPQAAYFYYLDFVTGEVGYLPRVNSLQVRAVRTITQ